MIQKKGFWCWILVLGMIFAVSLSASADQGRRALLESLNLTSEQVSALRTIFDEHNAKQYETITELENKVLALEQELRRQDRFENVIKEKISVHKSNELIKSIGSLYGQVLRTRVEYLLKAKDILNKEQRLRLISGLTLIELEIPDDLSYYMDFDIQAPDLDLSVDQRKKILRHRTDMEIQELRLELKIEYNLIDLQNALSQEEIDSQAVNQAILNIADLETKFLDNKIAHFLKAKDVLTKEQKEKLLHLLLM
jgi:Spy/CpxP family protein refolding chaperone